MAEAGKQTVLAVIPARFASTRFPGKIIAPLAGKPLVCHTYARTCDARLLSSVVVAVDHPDVRKAVEAHGIPVIMTRNDHPSGTDRIAEVAASQNADIIVNVQGDEPLIDPNTIDEAVQALLDNPDVPMATARRAIGDPEEIQDPNLVKVVCDERGRALYFSRFPIPFVRDVRPGEEPESCRWQHIGLYAYRRDFLIQYSQWPQTPLERLEKLEQLRVLEHGYPIAVVDTQYRSVGVDTPEDLERVRTMLEGALEGAG